MRRCSAQRLLVAFHFAIPSCVSGPEPEAAAPEVLASEALPGGETSVAFTPMPSFELPAANLGPEARSLFFAGKALSEQPWVKAPSITDARDGLGPLYHAASCLECHVHGGRGPVQREDGELTNATLVRLSLEGESRELGVVPEPHYGTQLAPRSIALRDALNVAGDGAAADEIAREGRATVRWHEEHYRYPDGHEVMLRRPTLELTDLGYGALHPDTQRSLRHTPPLHGLGLLSLIEQADLARLEDPEDRDGDGISGRQNLVWDPVQRRTQPGRFGHKANQPTLRVQVAAALHGDLGITSSVFPELPCTEAQLGCARAVHGAGAGAPEVSDELLDLMLGFVRSIGVPKRRKPDDPLVRRGRELFHRSGCVACHTPRFVTGDDPSAPHLSKQEIWPYTDLLVHDMGEGLDDGRRDFTATGAEWRTPPLWGVGLARAVHEDAGLLHDGRARTVEEAVLWHEGEARESRERFAALSVEDRAALLAFVRSL